MRGVMDVASTHPVSHPDKSQSFAVPTRLRAQGPAAPTRLRGLWAGAATQVGWELSMSEANVEQTSYEMPPREGFTVAHFLTVADIERSVRFYEKVFGGRVLSRGDRDGAPGYIQIANTWLIVNVGGGPTP